VLLLLAFSLLLGFFEAQRLVQLMFGVAFGIILSASSLSFTMPFRHVAQGSLSALRPLLHLILISSTLFALFAALAGLEGGKSGHLFSTHHLVGSFMFGAGMQFGGGCGSGVLYTAAAGSAKAVVTLVFFIVGSVLGAWSKERWSALSSAVWVNWPDAILYQWLLIVGFIGIAYVATHLTLPHVAGKDSKKTRREGSMTTSSDLFVDGGEIPVLCCCPWLSRRSVAEWRNGWWKMPLTRGRAILLIGVLNPVMVLVSGGAWGITYAYALWGSLIIPLFGGQPCGWGFFGASCPGRPQPIEGLTHPIAASDFGVFCGSLIAALFITTPTVETADASTGKQSLTSDDRAGESSSGNDSLDVAATADQRDQDSVDGEADRPNAGDTSASVEARSAAAKVASRQVAVSIPSDKSAVMCESTPKFISSWRESWRSIRESPSSLLYNVAGGLMMGQGARMAGGCNIGGFFSTVTVLDFRGFIWAMSALLGACLALFIVSLNRRIWDGWQHRRKASAGETVMVDRVRGA